MISTVSGYFWFFFKEIVLSFISFHVNVNFCPEWECMTQNNTKQLPTCLDLHFLVPSVFHFVLTCAESLSHFVALHPLPLLNNDVNHQMIPYLFFELGPPIKLSRQPNMCLSKPVPLTCNISAGTNPSNQYFRSPKGTFSKALEMFFCIYLLNHPQSNVLVSIPLMWRENTLVWD